MSKVDVCSQYTSFPVFSGFNGKIQVGLLLLTKSMWIYDALSNQLLQRKVILHTETGVMGSLNYDPYIHKYHIQLKYNPE